MELNLNGLVDRASWEAAGYQLPQFDIQAVTEKTKKAPNWLHIGGGNIFRAFPAAVLQRLLDEGNADTGLVVAECFDGDIIERAYQPYDNLSLLCTLGADGSVKKKVIASVVESLRCDGEKPEDDARLQEIMASPSLQMVSFTITEKGYAYMDSNGVPLSFILKDISRLPHSAQTTIGKITAGLLARFENGAHPVALLSMDNCSHNGDKLRAAVLYIAEGWRENQYVSKDFIQYLLDETKVAFPISMIDKITPRPDDNVAAMLKEDGFVYAAPFVTRRNTYTAAYVNAEETEYLVAEDKFPAGRPALEKAGIYFVERDVVDKCEKMKVCTCLNPLHTCLAVLGCILGHTFISKEMQDEDLNKLVHRIAYQEAMPVVVDPGILSPAEFAKEVLEKRFPNPFMPDTPQRIATDTSQKLSIRFGETLKAYAESPELDVTTLKCIPFVLAAWLRYLMALDDNLEEFTPSSDPLLETMQNAISFIKIKSTVTVEQLAPILDNEDIFGVKLTKIGLAELVTEYLNQMLEGKGAVRAALKKLLAE